jgi:hypothetical protein
VGERLVYRGAADEDRIAFGVQECAGANHASQIDTHTRPKYLVIVVACGLVTCTIIGKRMTRMHALLPPADWRHNPAFGTVGQSSEVLCWSRMQAEAGQELTAIMARKELERLAGDGLFFWGVGNAPSRAVGQLARIGHEIDVLFSVMKSRPKAVDSKPGELVIWRRFIDAHGVEQPMPPHALVTSRGKTRSGTKRSHYALVCRSERPLTLSDFGSFDPSAYRNVSGKGAPVGASQVTALLRRVGCNGESPDYRINAMAKLTKSYWVKLVDPLPMSRAKRFIMAKWLSDGRALSVADWQDLAAQLRAGQPLVAGTIERQPRLF